MVDRCVLTADGFYTTDARIFLERVYCSSVYCIVLIFAMDTDGLKVWRLCETEIPTE